MCWSKNKTFDAATLAELKKLPAFRYMKEPVDTVAELYSRYPDGNEKNTFAFVYTKNTFYFYRPSTATVSPAWVPISSDLMELFDLPDVGEMLDGDGFVWDADKQKFVIINMAAGGIIFQDMEVQSVGDLSTVENPKDRWGVYVIDEGKYYQYDASDETWSRTPYGYISSDAILRSEIEDNLQSSNPSVPLSANQGRILNEKKQEAKPDGNIPLIGVDGKVSDEYMPDYTESLQYKGTIVSSNGAILSSDADYNGRLIDGLDVANIPVGYFFTVGDGVTITLGEYTGVAGDKFVSNGGAGWSHIGTPGNVTGIKGDAETEYRSGNVNITAANILGRNLAEEEDAFLKNILSYPIIDGDKYLPSRYKTTDTGESVWEMERLDSFIKRNSVLGELSIPTDNSGISEENLYKEAIEALQGQICKLRRKSLAPCIIDYRNPLVTDYPGVVDLEDVISYDDSLNLWLSRPIQSKEIAGEDGHSTTLRCDNISEATLVDSPSIIPIIYSNIVAPTIYPKPFIIQCRALENAKTTITISNAEVGALNSTAFVTISKLKTTESYSYVCIGYTTSK